MSTKTRTDNGGYSNGGSLRDFWKDMPWYAKLASIAMIAIIYISILFVRQVPASIETLEVRLQAHAEAVAMSHLQTGIDSDAQSAKLDESIKLLRSICVSLAVMAKTDQTRCF